MNCLNCGAESIITANYCRMCGHRLREVSAPIAPNLPDLARALKKLFVGIAFLIIALVPLVEGEPMMWWLLFPGIPMIVKGVRLLAQVNTARGIQNHQQAVPVSSPTMPIVARISSDVRARPTGELKPPPSVTKNTTKLLEDGSSATK